MQRAGKDWRAASPPQTPRVPAATSQTRTHQLSVLETAHQRSVCARSPEKIGTLQHCAQPSTATPPLLCLGVQVCEGSTACSFCAANSFARFPLHAAHFTSLHIMRPEMPQIILCDPAHWPLPPHLHNCNAHNFLIRSGLYQLQCGLLQ